MLAVNHDPQAPVFGGADIGIVGDWQETVRLLTEALARELARPSRTPPRGPSRQAPGGPGVSRPGAAAPGTGFPGD